MRRNGHTVTTPHPGRRRAYPHRCRRRRPVAVRRDQRHPANGHAGTHLPTCQRIRRRQRLTRLPPRRWRRRPPRLPRPRPRQVQHPLRQRPPRLRRHRPSTPSTSPTPSSTPTPTPTTSPTTAPNMKLLGTWTTHFIPSRAQRQRRQHPRACQAHQRHDRQARAAVPVHRCHRAGHGPAVCQGRVHPQRSVRARSSQGHPGRRHVLRVDDACSTRRYVPA